MKKVVLNRNYVVNFSTNEIKYIPDNTIRKVEPRLMQLLKILVENEGQVISRARLTQEIWGNYGTGDDLLTHSICLLRNTLDKSIIRTVPKQGYKIQAEVSQSNSRMSKVLEKITFSRVAAGVLVIWALKMILFPHH